MGKYDFDLDLVYSNSVLKILEQIKTHSVVLEFGPANGRMTKYMKNALNCDVYLAELDEAAGKEALQYGVDLVVGDIENYEWYDRYRDIRFDYIVFADVLEHLRNPLEVLIKAKALLKVGGSVLLSVPNFAHNAVLINLLHNELDYRDIGLLDNTHIHMFTKNSLEKMLDAADLYPVKKMATYAKVGEMEIPADPDSITCLGRAYWNSRPYGEVYQFVYQVKKKSEWSNKAEYELRSVLSPNTIKVYHDNGEGYGEDSVIIQCIENINVENRIIIALNPDEKTIRIDPIEQSGIIKLVSCVGIAGDKKISLTVDNHNAGLVYEDVYFFETIDPQWEIKIPEGDDLITHVEAVISYVVLFDGKKVKTIVESLIRSEETEFRLRSDDAVLALKNEFEEKIRKQDQISEEKFQQKQKELDGKDLEIEKQANELKEIKEICKEKDLEIEKQANELKEIEEICIRETNKCRENEKELRKILLDKEETLKELRRQIEQRQSELQSRIQHIQFLEETLDEKDAAIQAIYDSGTWKWDRRINRILGKKL